MKTNIGNSVKLAAVLLLCAMAGSGANGIDFSKGFSGVATRAVPAVVFIQVEKEIPASSRSFSFNNPFDQFGDEFIERFFGVPRQHRQTPRGPQERERMSGQGSGFIISKDGYILTNTHVVGDADKITVRLNNGNEYLAKRIGADAKTEVALIKIDAEEELPILEIGDSKALMPGEWVIAIGNPFGLKETLTVGVVSAKGRTGMGIATYEDFIQTDAAINPGNSGGPLLNIEGKAAGINTAIYSRSGGYMGIGFAVPIDMAISIKDQLVAEGRVTRGYLGIYMNPGEVTEELARSFGHNQAGGVLIAEVEEGGPADKAGITSGDILIELNGQKIKDSLTFRNDVARIMPNNKADIKYYRNGKLRKAVVTVGTLPEDEQEVSAQERLMNKLGFQVRPLDNEAAEQFNLEPGDGLLVTKVQPGSEAERQGLKPETVILEVNRKKVRNVADLREVLNKKGRSTVLLRVKTKAGVYFLQLKIEE